VSSRPTETARAVFLAACSIVLLVIVVMYHRTVGPVSVAVVTCLSSAWGLWDVRPDRRRKER
jgi:Flp pilus assembly protein TadB